MSASDLIGLGLIGAGILALDLHVAVWATRDARRRERARIERYRTR